MQCLMVAACGTNVGAGGETGKDIVQDTFKCAEVCADPAQDTLQQSDSCDGCGQDLALADAAAAGDSTQNDVAATDAPADAVDALASDLGKIDPSKGDADANDSAAGAEVADAAAKDNGMGGCGSDVCPEDIGKIDTAPDSVDAKTADTGPAADVNWPDGKCASEQACKNAQKCFAPGESMGCGMCFNVPDPCQSDAACGKGQICQPTPCACGGESSCQAGCTLPSDCKEGTFCAPDGNCVADVCKIVDPPGLDPSCKPNFVCVNAANPHCQRKTCATSGQCQGACVKGLCYGEPGFCSYPPP